MRAYLTAAVVSICTMLVVPTAAPAQTPPLQVSPQMLEMIGAVPCQTFIALASTRLPANILDSLGQMMAGNAMASRFGNVCTMAAYLVQVCTTQPMLTLKGAFAELMAMKGRRAPLPPVPQCGA